MRLQKVFGEEDDLNFVDVEFLFPTLRRFNRQKNNREFAENGFRFEAMTALNYEQDYYFWRFEFLILGFGFKVIRQNGY